MRSQIDYDAPLTATGLNILDSVPKMDEIGKIALRGDHNAKSGTIRT